MHCTNKEQAARWAAGLLAWVEVQPVVPAVALTTRERIEAYKKRILKELVKRLNKKELGVYNRIFPAGPSDEEYFTVVDLIERTLVKRK